MTDQASERRKVADGSDNVLELQEISTSLIREGNLDALYGRILDAAISLLSADMGSMQILSPERSPATGMSCPAEREVCHCSVCHCSEEQWHSGVRVSSWIAMNCPAPGRYPAPRCPSPN